jgi:hypothetical protein
LRHDGKLKIRAAILALPQAQFFVNCHGKMTPR